MGVISNAARTAESNVIVLRDPETGSFEATEATEEAQDRAVADAEHRKAIWEHREVGAKARAGRLPRQLIAGLAAGTANLMLMKLLQEELVPATAKEAAEIAKIANAIFREASGQTAGNKNLTPAEREARMGEVDALERELAERARQTDAQLSGALGVGEPVPEPAPANVWDHDPDAGA